MNSKENEEQDADDIEAKPFNNLNLNLHRGSTRLASNVSNNNNCGISNENDDNNKNNGLNVNETDLNETTTATTAIGKYATNNNNMLELPNNNNNNNLDKSKTPSLINIAGSFSLIYLYDKYIIN
jgi:hypothetical protein